MKANHNSGGKINEKELAVVNIVKEQNESKSQHGGSTIARL